MNTGYPCLTCNHYRGGVEHGNCTRPMLMQDGTTITLPRPHQTERDEKHPFWKTKSRNRADICGKAGKNWTART
jgi:hypothetical protein